MEEAAYEPSLVWSVQRPLLVGGIGLPMCRTVLSAQCGSCLCPFSSLRPDGCLLSPQHPLCFALLLLGVPGVSG